MSALPAAERGARAVVIDTNCVLDLWLFHDPGMAALARALGSGAARWLATAAMRAELARVLDYPAIVRQLRRRAATAADVLALFDRHAERVPPAPPAGVRCRDPDDQIFVDLAVAHHADLYSRDHALAELARRLRLLGVAVAASALPARARASGANNGRVPAS